MKLITFQHNDEFRVGALVERDAGQRVVDLNQADDALPSDMLGFLAGGSAALQRARVVVAEHTSSAEYDLEQVRLKAPVPNPGKIICIGLNYRDHAEESKLPIPAYPAVFSKYANAVIGPGETIVIPRVTQQVDYEGELGVVIGREGRYIPVEQALDYVGGYIAFNDVSARDFQMRTSQWTIGKTFDTFAPTGPALVTADEVPDPHDLGIRVSIGDEILQSSNTRHLIFSVPELMMHLSEVMTLKPGDIIATGTPGGVGFARTPPRFLQPGETVQVQIERLGTLSNPVAAEL
jgi:2-keto-4-pentenoate hydratase/2-oxohepta-3-ene-1,7-dioic acid hydratase in catechol pathway